MRVSIAAAVIVGLALFGYASFGGVSAQGQSVQTVVRPGERVTFKFDQSEVNGRDCTVVAIRGDFVQCELAPPQIGEKSRERWYNLRTIVSIVKPAE